MLIYQNVLKAKIKFPEKFNRKAADLIVKLLKHDPAKRLGNLFHGIQEIKDDPFLSEMNWIMLEKKSLMHKVQFSTRHAIDHLGFIEGFKTEPERLSPADDPFLHF